MNKIIKTSISLLLVVVAIISCERKPINDECTCNATISIPINIDWTKSGVTPQNVTVLFYNAEDGSLAHEHTFEHNNNDIQSYAQLEEGKYNAVIFNELRDQIDYISCVGYDNLSTLKFEGNDDEPLRSRIATRSYIKQSGDLAVTTVENIEVTNQNAAVVESLMGVIPNKINTTIKITAHVDNIFYARMPALVDLVNLADGYYVYGDKNSSTTSTLQFTMNNRVYDEGSYYNGTISTTVTTFGTLEDRASTSAHNSSTPVILDLLFKQVNKEQTEVSIEMDVTTLITHTQQPDGSYLINIDATFKDKLPAVQPESSNGDSGFGAEVENWEDVNVPLKQ